MFRLTAHYKRLLTISLFAILVIYSFPQTQIPVTRVIGANNVVFDGVVSGGEYAQSLVLDATTGFEMYYTIDTAITRAFIAIRAQCTGWIAIGIDYSARMADSDIIIGYYSGGSFISDNWGIGETSHDADTAFGGTNNIINFAAGESGGWTTLEFSRNQTTSDVYDNAIVTGVPTPLIWAYHNSKDDFTSRHSARGFSSVTFTSATVPTAPQNFAATYGDSQVSLAWQAPSDDGGDTITNYNVYRAIASGGPFTQAAAPVGLSYTDLGRTNGVTYYYKVAAVNGVGEGANSTTVSATPRTTPSEPRNLGASYGYGYANVSWIPPLDDGGTTITKYLVYRATASIGPYTNIQNSTSLYYLDNTVGNGNTYYYRVSAYNSEGEGTQAAYIIVTPGATPTFPQNLQASYSDSQVSLTWQAPLDNGGFSVTKYRVYRGTSASGPFTNVGNSTTLNYDDFSVTNGIAYWYNVTAINSEGESPSSNQVPVTPATLPTAPRSLQATYQDSQVSLNWLVPLNSGGYSIVNYSIYRATSAIGPFTFLDNTTSLSYTDTAVTNGNQYWYNVTATTIEGEGSSSNVVTVTPATIPTAPQNLQVTAGDWQVSLSWLAPSDSGGYPVTKYIIYRATSSSGPFTNIANSTILSYIDSSVTNGIIYWYNVTAYTAEGEGPTSNQMSATPTGPPTPPQTLKVNKSGTDVILNWTVPANDGGSAITKYRVFRSQSSGGSYNNIANTTTLSYVDTSGVTGQQYFYVVTAVNALGESFSSNEVAITIGNVPSEPLSVVATHGNGQIDLSWAVPSSQGGSAITQYRVYRSLTTGGPYSNIINTTNLFYLDTSLTNGQMYFYVITAENNEGESPYSQEVNATPATIPSAPQSLQASYSDSQVVLTWGLPNNDGGSQITEYMIYRASSPTGPYVNIGNSSILSYTDFTVANGETYWYNVTAVNGEGKGPSSNQVGVTPITVPTAPQSLQASYSDSQVTIIWQVPVYDGNSTITGYNIYRATSPSGSYVLIGTSPGLTYTDLSVSNGITYWYNVTAVNAEGEGPSSNQVGVTPITVPTAPQNLAATYGDSQVTLTWSLPSDDGGSPIIEYVVYRGTSPSGPFSNVGNSTTLGYIDSTAVNGITYWYNVTAINAEGEGPSSFQQSATPATVPTAPLNPQVIPGNSQISVSWEAPADDGGSTIIRYRVYRRITSGSFLNIQNVTGTTSYLDSSVTNGIKYFYVIVAVNGEGESVASGEVSTTPLAVPSSPRSLNVVYTVPKVTLSWIAPLDDGGTSIVQYRIYRSTSSGGPYTNLANTTLLSFDDVSTTKGITYYYAVSADNSLGESIKSSEAIITPTTKPSPPESLYASLDSNNYVILLWNTPSDTGGLPISSYQIYRSETSGGPYTSIGSTMSVSYTDSSVLSGTTYFYVIRAVNSQGESVDSNEDGITVPTQTIPSTTTTTIPPTTPTAPTQTTTTNTTTIPQTSTFALNAIIAAFSAILIWNRIRRKK
ncbi:MAG: fibronectin type III domain-containing protein [Candidatus Heimdallarchaeota archaeon]